MAGFYKAPYQAPKLATGMAAPQKTIQPVNPATGAAPPAPANPAGGQSWTDFSKSYDGAAPNIGSLSGVHNSKLFNTMTNQIASQIGFTGNRSVPGTYQFENANEGGTFMDTAQGSQASPEFLKALEAYQFSRNPQNNLEGTISQDGQSVGTFTAGNKDTGFDKFAKTAIPIGLAAIAGGAAGLFGPVGGAEAAVGNGAFLGEGVASGIPAWDAAAGIGLAETGAATGLSLEAAGLPGAETFGFQNVGAAGAEAGLGNGAFLGEGVASGIPQWDIAAGLGSGVEAMPFIPGADSAATGIASAATAPSTVNLGSLGGTMGTAGGISGAIAQALADPANALKTAGSSVLDFAKANPQLAAMGVGALGSLTGSKPEMPSMGGAPGGGGLTPGAQGVAGSLGALDFSGIPALQTSAGDRDTFNQEAIDAAYGMQTRYLDPQVKQQQQALEARLAEQGFVPGTPAYNQAMQNFMDTNARAYAQARDSSILQGAQIGQGDYRNAISGATLNNSASAQALEQYLAKRNQPINERNALLGGDQIVYNQQLDKYNAQVAESNNRNSALSQLALALGMYLG